MNRLYKSKNKKIAGVCEGISHYINPDLDPVLVRAAWVALSLINPLFLIFYFVLALALPEAPYKAC
ncbi:MAG: PspC domain-containing protein [Marinifilaceae bacterium]